MVVSKQKCNAAHVLKNLNAEIYHKQKRQFLLR